VSGALHRLVRPYLKRPGGPRVTDGEMLLFIVCVLVTTVGLSGDIARHVQNPGDLEGDFLSGWHLVLYGGVAAVGACIGLGALRRGPSYVGAVGTGTIGFLLLAVGGVADAAWHEVFGTEARVEALVSPPHLLVFAGLAFLLTAPIVVAWERPDRRLGWIASIAVCTSMISMLLVTSLFTGYSSPLSGGVSFDTGYVEPVVGESNSEYDVVRGLSMIVWLAAILSAAHALVLLRFRPKPGLVALGFALLAIPPYVIGDSDTVKALSLGLVAAGLVAEAGVAVFGRPVLGRLGAVATMALANAALWASAFLVLDLDEAMAWPVHLWTGAIAISVLVAAAAAGVVGLRIPTAAELGEPDDEAPEPDRAPDRPPAPAWLDDLDDDELFVR